MFALDERLREDTVEVASLKLSLVLLMKDRSFPWLILVPRMEGVREIHELTKVDRSVLIEEIALTSRIIEEIFKTDKINIGALGNIVSQLHVHIIGRFRKDASWPGAVWGRNLREPYPPEELENTKARLKAAFEDGGFQ